MAQEIKKIKLNPLRVSGHMDYRTVKHRFDVLASGTALVLLSLLFLVLTILIKKEDGGLVFYLQERIGKGERPSKIWKLRSIIIDANKMVEQLEKQNEIDGTMFEIKDDPRVTKIGRVTRKYSLDELPQPWNVLKGNISLIGSRPPLPIKVANYTDYDKLRLTVTPGCIGLWRVIKRDVADFDGMVELDLEYINDSSLWSDFKILLKTVGVIIHSNSAY